MIFFLWQIPYVEAPPLQAIEQLLEVEDSKGEKAYDGDTICIGLARYHTNQTLLRGISSMLIFSVEAMTCNE